MFTHKDEYFEGLEAFSSPNINRPCGDDSSKFNISKYEIEKFSSHYVKIISESSSIWKGPLFYFYSKNHASESCPLRIAYLESIKFHPSHKIV